MYPRYNETLGAVAEWLGSGLQSRLHQFESGRRLNGRRPARAGLRLVDLGVLRATAHAAELHFQPMHNFAVLAFVFPVKKPGGGFFTGDTVIGLKGGGTGDRVIDL